MDKILRKRSEPISNYEAVFLHGKTIRFRKGPNRPILPLKYPEIEDVSLGTQCTAGCPYCYTSALRKGKLYDNVVEKILDYYGNLSLDQRPFQVAIGGGGEPTEHPDFIQVLKTFRYLKILPNYTTNGLYLSKEILDTTLEVCGGVAVSCHPHLDKVWKKAVQSLVSKGIKTSVHIIIGQEGSDIRFWELFDSLNGIDSFVALPYIPQGRAQEINTLPVFNSFFNTAIKIKPKNLAVGALFYPYLLENQSIPRELSLSIYEPEILSGYRMLDDDYKTLRKSSFDHTPKFGEKNDY